jgi:hypothetical protein
VRLVDGWVLVVECWSPVTSFCRKHTRSGPCGAVGDAFGARGLGLGAVAEALDAVGEWTRTCLPNALPTKAGDERCSSRSYGYCEGLMVRTLAARYELTYCHAAIGSHISRPWFGTRKAAAVVDISRKPEGSPEGEEISRSHDQTTHADRAGGLWDLKQVYQAMTPALPPEEQCQLGITYMQGVK